MRAMCNKCHECIVKNVCELSCNAMYVLCVYSSKSTRQNIFETRKLPLCAVSKCDSSGCLLRFLFEKKRKQMNQQAATERRNNHQPSSPPTLNEFVIELGFYGSHGHVLPIRGAVRLVEWSPTVKKILTPTSIPQANAPGFPHE